MVRCVSPGRKTVRILAAVASASASVQVRLARMDEADLLHHITQTAFAEYRGSFTMRKVVAARA
jgi:hypothetical protein